MKFREKCRFVVTEFVKTCDELFIQDGYLADWKSILHNVHNLVQFFSLENHNFFLFNKFVLAQGDSPGFFKFQILSCNLFYMKIIQKSLVPTWTMAKIHVFWHYKSQCQYLKVTSSQVVCFMGFKTA